MKRRLRRWLQRRLAGADRLRNSILEICPGDPLAERFAEFGSGSVLKFPWRDLGNTTSVAIGSDVTIRSGLALEALAPEGVVVIRIGDGCHLGYGIRIVAVNGVTIGRVCGIGHGVTLADTVHDYKAATDGASWEGDLKLGRPLVIEDGAWIGNNTVVAGGITIGRGAVLGANSYVNRDVPPATVVAGNPARAVRRRRPDGEWEWLVDPESIELGLPETRGNSGAVSDAVSDADSA